MSTAQFGIEVKKIEGDVITLRVLLISEDSELPMSDDLDFFVRVFCDHEPIIDNPRPMKAERASEPNLLERIRKMKGSPYDVKWLSKHARTLVPKVVLVQMRNLDKEAIFSSYQRGKQAWKNEDQLQTAVFEVTVDRVETLKHLRVGDVWETCAFASEIDFAPPPAVAAHA